MTRTRPDLWRSVRSAPAILFGLGLSAASAVQASPINITPVEFDTEGEHFSYRLHMEMQGEDMYWDVRQGPELTEVGPSEGYSSGLAGNQTLVTGPALGHRLYRLEEGDALAPVFSAEQSSPPAEFEDMFDNRQRINEVRVELEATGDSRELAGRQASEYNFATIADMTRIDEDGNQDYYQMNYGQVWIFEDLPFSSASIQPSPGIFNMATAPSSTPELADHFLQEMVAAIEPLGMLAGLSVREYFPDADVLETLAAQGWSRDEDMSLGQARGQGFELLISELHEDAERPEYALYENSVMADPATVEFLGTPMFLADVLDVCPALPADMPLDELQANMAQFANFNGSINGALEGDLIGGAGFGVQGDSGFALTVDAYDEDLQRTACLLMMRVASGAPEAGSTLEVAPDQSASPEQSGQLITYLLIADISERGEIEYLSVGAADAGTVRIDTANDEEISGQFELSGSAVNLHELSEVQTFELRGEFDAIQVHDRIPTIR